MKIVINRVEKKVVPEISLTTLYYSAQMDKLYVLCLLEGSKYVFVALGDHRSSALRTRTELIKFLNSAECDLVLVEDFKVTADIKE